MNLKQELKKMNLSDLRWICKKLYIEYKQKDSKSILIKNLLSPLNRKYKMQVGFSRKRGYDDPVFDIKGMEEHYNEIFSAIVQSIISWLPSTDNGDMVAIKNLFFNDKDDKYQFLQTVKQRMKPSDPDWGKGYITYDNFVKRINACQQLMKFLQTADSPDDDLEPLRPGLYNVGNDADFVHYYAVIDLDRTGLSVPELNEMFGSYGNGIPSDSIFSQIFGNYIVVNGYYDGWPADGYDPRTRQGTPLNSHKGSPEGRQDKLNPKRFIGLDAQPASGLCQCNAIISMLACNGGGVTTSNDEHVVTPREEVFKEARKWLIDIKKNYKTYKDNDYRRYLENEKRTFKTLQTWSNEGLINDIPECDFKKEITGHFEGITKEDEVITIYKSILKWLNKIGAYDKKERKIDINKLLQIILLEEHDKHFKFWSDYVDLPTPNGEIGSPLLGQMSDDCYFEFDDLVNDEILEPRRRVILPSRQSSFDPNLGGSPNSLSWEFDDADSEFLNDIFGQSSIERNSSFQILPGD